MSTIDAYKNLIRRYDSTVKKDSLSNPDDKSRLFSNTTTKETEKTEGNVWDKIQGTGLEVQTNVIKGVMGGIEGVVDLVATGAGWIGKLFGADVSGITDFIGTDFTQKFLDSDFAQNVAGFTANPIGFTVDSISGKGAKKLNDYLDFSYTNQLPEVVGNTLENIEVSVGMMLPSILSGGLASGAKLGKAVSMATFGAGATGQATQEALNDGATFAQATGYGLLQGAKEVGTEMLVGGALDKVLGTGNKLFGVVGGVGKASKEVVEETTKGALKTFVKDLAKTGFEEGTEEAVGSLFEPLIANITYKGFEENRVKYDGEWFEEMVQSFIAGALTGGVMGGGSIYSGIKQYGSNYKSVLENTQKANEAIESYLKNPTQDMKVKTEQILRESFEQVDEAYKYVSESRGVENAKTLNVEQAKDYLSELNKNGIENANQSIVKELTKKLGYKIEFEKGNTSYVDFDNKTVVYGSDVIKDNANATKEFAHEITHISEGSKGYEELKKEIVSKVKSDDSYSRMFNKKAVLYKQAFLDSKIGKEVLKKKPNIKLMELKENSDFIEYINQEIVADYSKTMFKDLADLKRFVGRSVSKLQKLKNYFDKNYSGGEYKKQRNLLEQALKEIHKEKTRTVETRHNLTIDEKFSLKSDSRVKEQTKKILEEIKEAEKKVLEASMTRHKQVSSYSALRLYAKLYNEYNKEVNRIFEETKNGNVVALDIDFARELKELLEGAKEHALSFFTYASKLSGIENKSENYKNIINKATAKARELYHTLSKLDLSRIQATSKNFKEEKEQVVTKQKKVSQIVSKEPSSKEMKNVVEYGIDKETIREVENYEQTDNARRGKETERSERERAETLYKLANQADIRFLQRIYSETEKRDRREAKKLENRELFKRGALEKLEKILIKSGAYSEVSAPYGIDFKLVKHEFYTPTMKDLVEENSKYGLHTEFFLNFPIENGIKKEYGFGAFFSKNKTIYLKLGTDELIETNKHEKMHALSYFNNEYALKYSEQLEEYFNQNTNDYDRIINEHIEPNYDFYKQADNGKMSYEEEKKQSFEEIKAEIYAKQIILYDETFQDEIIKELENSIEEEFFDDNTYDEAVDNQQSILKQDTRLKEVAPKIVEATKKVIEGIEKRNEIEPSKHKQNAIKLLENKVKQIESMPQDNIDIEVLKTTVDKIAEQKCVKFTFKDTFSSFQQIYESRNVPAVYSNLETTHNEEQSNKRKWEKQKQKEFKATRDGTNHPDLIFESTYPASKITDDVQFIRSVANQTQDYYYDWNTTSSIVDSAVDKLASAFSVEGVKPTIKYPKGKNSSRFDIIKQLHHQMNNKKNFTRTDTMSRLLNSIALVEVNGTQLKEHYINWDNSFEDLVKQLTTVYDECGNETAVFRSIKRHNKSIEKKDKMIDRKEQYIQELLKARSELKGKYQERLSLKMVRFRDILKHKNEMIGIQRQTIKNMKNYYKDINNILYKLGKMKEQYSSTTNRNTTINEGVYLNEFEAVMKPLKDIITSRGYISGKVRSQLKVLSDLLYTSNSIENIKQMFEFDILKENLDTITQNLLNDKGEVNTRALSSEEVHSLSKIIDYTKRAYNLYEEQYKALLFPAVSKAVDTITTAKKAKQSSAIARVLKSTWNKLIDPRTRFSLLESKTDGFFSKDLYEMLRRAENKRYEVRDNLQEEYVAFTKNNSIVKKLKRKNFSINEVNLTDGEAISLYMLSKRENQALRHILNDENFKGNGITLSRKGFEVKVLPSLDDLNRLSTYVEGEYTDFIKVLKDLYYNKVAKEYNETIKENFGYEVKLEDSYFPMHLAESEITSNVGDASTISNRMLALFSPSFTKKTSKTAQSALKVLDIVSTTNHFIDTLATYSAMNPTVRKINAIMNAPINIEGEKTTVSKYIHTTLDSSFKNYLDNLLLEMQGMHSKETGRTNKTFGAIRSKIARSTLGVNFSVMFQQFASFPMVLSEVGFKSTMRGLTMSGTSEFMINNSPYFKNRFTNDSVVKATLLTEGTAKGVIDKIGNISTKGIGLMDKFTVVKVYNSCLVEICLENKVKAKEVQQAIKNATTEPNNPLLDYAKEALERAELVTRKTQPQYSALENGSITWTNNELIKSALMYTSVKRKYLSALTSKLHESVATKNVKPFAITLSAFVISQVMASTIAKTFKSILGKDDEDEDKFLGLLKTTLENCSVNMIPIVSDFYNYVANGYEIDNVVLEYANDLVEALQGFSESLEGTIADRQKGIYNLSKVLGQTLGLPVKNTVEYLTMALRVVNKDASIKAQTIIYNIGRSDIVKSLEDSYNRGRVSTALGYLDALLEKGGLSYPSDVVGKEICRLYSTGYQNVLPTTTYDTLTINGTAYRLGNSVKVKFSNLYDKATNVVKAVVNSSGYRKLEDEARARIIKRVYTAYYDLAKKEVVDKDYEVSTFATLLEVMPQENAIQYVLKIDGLTRTNSQTKKQRIIAYIDSLSLSSTQKEALLQYSGYTK